MNRRILVMMSGSIAAYKVCHVLSRLKQAGHEIEVVASEWALRFIGEATIEGLIGRPVHKSMFGTGAHMAHINLIRWADLAIVCPATANTINKLSVGIGDDLMTSLFLAHDFSKPWLIAPAMNSKMYHHPTTQAAVKKLKELGCEILETASGVLACGEIGDGKLLDSELLLAEILRKLPKEVHRQDRSEKIPALASSKRFLVTSGGTQEPIDPVRSITNISTGRTGATIAEVLIGLGHSVHFLSSKSSVQPRIEEYAGAERFSVEHFITYNDLADLLKRDLEKYDFDTIIHAAAVSDFSLVDGAAKTKLDSSDTLVLNFKRNPKLLDKIRSWSKKQSIKIVAFKLTASSNMEDRIARLEKIMTDSQPDFVVTNDLSELPRWQIHEGQGLQLVEGTTREELGFALEALL